MARCGECLQSETQCTCGPTKAHGPTTEGFITTMPDGSRYFDGEAAAGIALLIFLGSLGAIGLISTLASGHGG